MSPSEKYEFVSWDDEIPNLIESHKIPWFQTTNQLGYYFNNMIGIYTWENGEINHGKIGLTFIMVIYIYNVL